MSKGVEFLYRGRETKADGNIYAAFPAPPYSQQRDQIFGRRQNASWLGLVVAAVMHDYYSVSAEQQRQMALNTIALCEMKYAEQEIKNEMDQ
jgi:hypothetical protein